VIYALEVLEATKIWQKHVRGASLPTATPLNSLSSVEVASSWIS
jgi:hypothetical protein